MGLTVVYGDNGAGKTGYIRILKSACRARGQEKILGNITSGTMPLTPVIAIKYKVGKETNPREWAGENKDDLISRVSVFDTQCAGVYLTEKTDVAFRPFGLDLFDKLVKAYKAVRVKLEAEQKALSTSVLAPVQATIPEGTAVSRFLANVSSLTKPEAVVTLASLSPDEEAKLALLEKSLLDLQANDPDKLIRELTLRNGRVQALIRHLKDVETALSDEAVTSVFSARTEGRRKSEEAKRLREATFPQGLLRGTGADRGWRFGKPPAASRKNRHIRERHFRWWSRTPNVFSVSRSSKVKRPRDSVSSKTSWLRRSSASSESLGDDYARKLKVFVELKISTEAIDETLKEIRLEHEAVSAIVGTSLALLEARRGATVTALVEDADLRSDCPAVGSVLSEVGALSMQMAERIKTLRTSADDQARKTMMSEAQELRARKILESNQQIVLTDIERRQKYAAYGLCIDETKTQTITAKSTSVTRTTVSQKLKTKFQDELIRLSFRHVEVGLKELGGADGVFYHKLALTRAPGVELQKVVSEGEQRCLSIAAFFAELCTADDPSGIVFDDPVSSLDFQWRNGVARRLVEESKTRQVIVFTHDVVFLLALRQYADELGVVPLDQHVRHSSKGAGVCAEELPWVALPVKKKLGFLNQSWQSTDKLSRDGHQDAYEKEAKYLYGLLRETWERALEEVLLGGVVERYRPSVQTQQLGRISDITAEDCRAVENAMTKCSTWLPGHDKAAAARAPVPTPAELKGDIDTLASWITIIRKRRQK